METRNLWVRIGAYIDVTDEEMEIITSDSDKSVEIIREKINNSKIIAEGETYIPMESIEDYNEKYGTDFTVRNYDFYF